MAVNIGFYDCKLYFGGLTIVKAVQIFAFTAIKYQLYGYKFREIGNFPFKTKVPLLALLANVRLKSLPWTNTPAY
jgi:hypothetical protein